MIAALPPGAADGLRMIWRAIASFFMPSMMRAG
jgi:hypothetical protein